MTLNEFKNELARRLYGISRTEALDAGICVECKMPVNSRCYSDAGRREYKISALCEVCFDKMFEEPQDE